MSKVARLVGAGSGHEYSMFSSLLCTLFPITTKNRVTEVCIKRKIIQNKNKKDEEKEEGKGKEGTEEKQEIQEIEKYID